MLIFTFLPNCLVLHKIVDYHVIPEIFEPVLNCPRASQKCSRLEVGIAIDNTSHSEFFDLSTNLGEIPRPYSGQTEPGSAQLSQIVSTEHHNSLLIGRTEK